MWATASWPARRGAALGLAVGLTLLPWIICNAWDIIYTFGGTSSTAFEPVTSGHGLSGGGGDGDPVRPGACFSTLAAVPAQLMRPKAPPWASASCWSGITPLWRRLSFNYKITLRNLFRYQRRFWMTVVGIGGCAALIVTAFGLRDSIFAVMDRQYDEIYRYTAQMGLVDRVTPGELAEVTGALERSELVSGWLVSTLGDGLRRDGAVHGGLHGGGGAQPGGAGPVCHLRHRTDSVPVLLPDDGWSSRRSWPPCWRCRRGHLHSGRGQPGGGTGGGCHRALYPALCVHVQRLL